MQIHTISFPPLGENCYLLADEAAGSACVIDPGGPAEPILAAARSLGVSIGQIFLTHGHFDHTDGVDDLCAQLPGGRVYLHSADRSLLGRRLLPALSGADAYPLPRTPLLPCQEGDLFPVGDLTLRVLHTPGHTPGGVCYLVEDVLFTGDTLFCRSAGRTDLPGGDRSALSASLRRLAALEGDYRLFPGHGEPSTLSEERDGNPYLRAAREGTV